MHDLRFVLDNLEDVRRRTEARGSSFDFAHLETLAAARRQAIQTFDTLRYEQRQASEGMKSLTPGSDEFVALRAKLKTMSDDAATADATRKQAEADMEELMLLLPNLISDHTPLGTSEDDNLEIRRWGAPREFDFPVRDHIDVGEDLQILDQEAAAKVSGARFVFMRGAGARLERALGAFMLDVQTQAHGYEEFTTPALVLREALVGTGQLPKFEEDLFRVGGSHYLIPTAEVTLTNFWRERLLESLPGTIKMCALTPCFRSEAGSHGRDTRGLIRQHQFNKVELVKIARPEDSYAELESLVRDAARILELLELPHRVLELCSADIGNGAARCYDIEVWMPAQDRYREISSCSNCETFQSRRASIRFRDENGKPQFAHTLNGSGLAVGRTLVALLENFQNADGTVSIPDVLRPYTGFDRIERRALVG